jgi:hypothetical protein
MLRLQLSKAPCRFTIATSRIYGLEPSGGFEGENSPVVARLPQSPGDSMGSNAILYLRPSSVGSLSAVA